MSYFSVLQFLKEISWLVHIIPEVFLRNLIEFLEGLPSEMCTYQMIFQHKILCCTAAVAALRNNTLRVLH